MEQRLRKLLDSGRVFSRVVAPVPFFPFGGRCFGKYSVYGGVAKTEHRHGIRVDHPRYLVIPKIGMSVTPALLAGAANSVVSRLTHQGCGFDIVDAHYLYPDGVAAAMICARLGKPLVITARGTDVNLIPRYRVPRRWILWAAKRASALVTVCQALKDALVEMGVPGGRIHVLRNGVDLDQFRPAGRERIRERLGLRKPTLVSVGHLIERKGHDLVIRALTELPDMELLIIGDGQQSSALMDLAKNLGVAGRVRFAGELPQAELARYYSAADALVLASEREGWPNVLLESMACGTPVIATRVWGTPEVVQASDAGLLIEERTPACIAAAARRLLADPPRRAATRHYAERFSWDETTRGQLDLFETVLDAKQ